LEKPTVTPDAIPDSVNVPLTELVKLGVEHWRLTDAVAKMPGGDAAAQVRHALRRMGEFLAGRELEVRPMDGRRFVAGLAARVVHSIDTPRLPAGVAVIVETVSPLVLWRGQVVQPAEVVTGRGTGVVK
jgi:hypothetical protein